MWPWGRECALRVSFLAACATAQFRGGGDVKSEAAGSSAGSSTWSTLACGLQKVPEVAEVTPAPRPDSGAHRLTFPGGRSPTWRKSPGAELGEPARDGGTSGWRLTYLPQLSLPLFCPLSLLTAISKGNSALLSLASHLQRRGANPHRQGARYSWREVPLNLGRAAQ